MANKVKQLSINGTTYDLDVNATDLTDEIIDIYDGSAASDYGIWRLDNYSIDGGYDGSTLPSGFSAGSLIVLPGNATDHFVGSTQIIVDAVSNKVWIRYYEDTSGEWTNWKNIVVSNSISEAGTAAALNYTFNSSTRTLTFTT